MGVCSSISFVKTNFYLFGLGNPALKGVPGPLSNKHEKRLIVLVKVFPSKNINGKPHASNVSINKITKKLAETS